MTHIDTVYPASTHDACASRAPQITVALNGVPANWLEAVEINRQPGPQLDTARLRAVPFDNAGQGRFEQLAILAGSSREICIWLYDETLDEDVTLFEGVITAGGARLDSKGETIELNATDSVNAAYDFELSDYRIVNPDGSRVVLSADEIIFNPEGRGNRSATKGPEGYYALAMSNQATAAWTAMEAVEYLAGEYMDAALLKPANLAALAEDDMVLPEIDVYGMTPLAALAKIAEQIGLLYRLAYHDAGGSMAPKLIFYRINEGQLSNPTLMPPGGAFEPGTTNLLRLELKTRTAGTTCKLIGRGGRKQFESTFELVEGWNQSLEQNDLELYSPATNPDYAGVRNVFRKYVLNETGTYSELPYNQGQEYDLSGVFGTSDYARRTRRFYPCLSRDASGDSYGYYLEVSYNAGSSWQPYGGAFDILRQECGVYISCEQFDPDMWVAICKDVLRFRITATLESDEPLEAVAVDGPDDGTRPVKIQLVNLGNRYAFRKVHADSIFAGGSLPTTPANEADDTEAIQKRLAAMLQDMRRAGADGKAELLLIRPGLTPGDRLDTIEGRDIDLKTLTGSTAILPQVHTVRLSFGDQWKTVIEF